MNANEMEADPLAELLRSQQRAIAGFRRRESEKAGRDIGGQAATERWFQECFADWVGEEREAIDRVLANEVPRVELPWRPADTQPLAVNA